MIHNTPNPHQGQPVLTAGRPLSQATTAMILLHGRGATAQSILSLVPELARPDFAYLAPQANNNTWYPNSFLYPLAQNEPGLSSGLQAIGELLATIVAAGIPAEKVIIGGFSQGACLSLEFAARHARRYGAIVGFSGGLIGPDTAPRDYPGSLAGTPIFLGCSDVDFHIPKARVQHTTQILTRLGGQVTERLYPNMGHTINQDEIAFVKQLMAGVAGDK